MLSTQEAREIASHQQIDESEAIEEDQDGEDDEDQDSMR